MRNVRMDNGGFRDVESGTELELVKSSQTIKSSTNSKAATSTPRVSKTADLSSTPAPSKTVQKYPVGEPKASTTAGPSSKPSRIVCRTEVCRAAKKTFLPPDLTDGPWNNFKTIAFTVLLVLFILWIIVFVVLRHLKIV